MPDLLLTKLSTMSTGCGCRNPEGDPVPLTYGGIDDTLEADPWPAHVGYCPVCESTCTIARVGFESE